MADAISNSTTPAPPPQNVTTPSPARQRDEVDQGPQQNPRAEALREDQQPQDRRPDPNERIGTQIDTEA